MNDDWHGYLFGIIIMMVVIFSIILFNNTKKEFIKNNVQDAENFFSGKHELLALNNIIYDSNESKSKSTGYLSGGFFLIAGGITGSYDSSSSSERKIYNKLIFCFESIHGDVISWNDFSINQVILHNIPKNEKPYVIFEWNQPTQNNSPKFSYENWRNYIKIIHIYINSSFIKNYDISLSLK